MFSLSIPNASTPFSLVLSATKCFATDDLSLHAFKNQSRAVWAFVIVSCVVNVLEAIKNSVSSGVIFLSTSAMSLPSILLTKNGCISFIQYGFNASVTICGPRSLPPIPILTMYFIFLPEYPFHSPLCTLLQNVFMWSSSF